MVETFALTLTTIRNVESLLQEYIRNFESHDHYDYAVIVVGDTKTPNMDMPNEKCELFDAKKQKEWLKDYPKLDKITPYNSDNRRNLGYLRAAELGADVIVSIDDDNFPVATEDFVKYHSIVGTKRRLNIVNSKNLWFNPCSLLTFNEQVDIYQRGFPYFQRFKENRFNTRNEECSVLLNMGLWLDHPDVDAVTRLCLPHLRVKSFRGNQQIALARNVATTINTQNTAFHKSILPCYYFLPMNPHICDRFGDIWGGFFAKKVIDAIGGSIAVGHPLVNHRRNVHDFVEDLRVEMMGILINEKLAKFLGTMQLDRGNCSDLYLQLSDIVEKQAHRLGNRSVQKFFGKVANAMKVWIEICDKI